MKGIPVGQDLDINIPPPRPKRKPSNPYPRKTSAGTPASQVGAKDGGGQNAISPSHGQKGLDLEKEPLPEVVHFLFSFFPSSCIPFLFANLLIFIFLPIQGACFGEKLPNPKENQDDNCSEVFNVLQETHCSSVSSTIKSPMLIPMAIRHSCTFKEFVPSLKEV